MLDNSLYLSSSSIFLGFTALCREGICTTCYFFPGLVQHFFTNSRKLHSHKGIWITTVLEGSWFEPWVWMTFIEVVSCPIYVSKFWILEIVYCWNCRFCIINILIRSSNECAEVVITCGVSYVGRGGNNNCYGIGYCCMDEFSYQRFGWFLQLGRYMLVDR